MKKYTSLYHKGLAWALVLILLLPSLVIESHAQNIPRRQDSQSASTSGTTLTFDDGQSTFSSFEYIITGAPATVSIVLSGCMRSGTCDTLNTYTTVANTVVKPAINGPYDNYTVAVTFTGGTSPVVKVNRLGLMAKGGVSNVGAFAGSPWYDITAYGGKCDGIFDNTIPFTTASTLANANNGIVHLPAGTCLVGALTGLTNTWVQGSGIFNTTLKLKNGANASLLTYTEQSNFALSDMTLEGNSANQSGTSNGVKITDVVAHNPRPALFNLYIAHFLSDGIHIDDNSSSGGQFRYLYLYFNDGNNIYDGGQDEFWDVVDSGQAGLAALFSTGSNNKWTNYKGWFAGRVTPASGYGVRLDSGSRVSMSATEAQDNQASGFLIKGNSHSLVGVLSNGNGQGVASGANTYGYYFFNATGVMLVGSTPANADLPINQSFVARFDTSTANIVELTAKQNGGFVTGTPAGNFIRIFDAAGTLLWYTIGLEQRYDTTGAIYTQTQTQLLGSDTGYIIDPIPSSGSLGSFVRLWRNVNTSGSVQMQFFKGDGTATVQAQINGATGAISEKSAILSDSNGGTWTQGTNSELLTLSTSGTTTDTVGSLLPANSIIEAVDARVTTTITTATSWQLGDPTTAGRFSAANATMTAGTTQVGTVMADQTGAAGPRQVAAAKVRVTTVGTPGAGVIRITVHFRTYVAPTS